MRIGGVPVTKCEEILVLPRIEGNLVFTAVAVPSMDYFDEVCPKPAPAMMLKAGGKREPKIDDNYVQLLEDWSQRRYAYICVKSLEPSDIEWDEVALDKPSTWTKWTDELREAGLSDVEINRVQTLVLDANSLNEAKLKEARDSFLRGQGETEAKSSGRKTTPESSQSGQLAKD